MTITIIIRLNVKSKNKNFINAIVFKLINNLIIIFKKRINENE